MQVFEAWGVPQVFPSRRVGSRCGRWMPCHQQRENRRGRRQDRSCLGEARVILGFGSQADQGFSGLQLEEVKVLTSTSHLPSVGIVSSGAAPEDAEAASCFSELDICGQQGLWRSQVKRSAVWFPSFQTCPLC